MVARTGTILTANGSDLSPDEFVVRLTAGQGNGITIYIPFSIAAKLNLSRGDIVKIKIMKGILTFKETKK